MRLKYMILDRVSLKKTTPVPSCTWLDSGIYSVLPTLIFNTSFAMQIMHRSRYCVATDCGLYSFLRPKKK